MYQSTELPTVFVGLNKNRIRVYDQKNIYLDDCEFQLEFFNPTANTIMAKIYLNDKIISYSGLVIRPGERVWLDRFLDENKKFKFTSYEVDSKDPSVKKAIANNGKIKVEFYKQQSPTVKSWPTYQPYYQPYYWPHWYYSPYWIQPGIFYCGTTTGGTVSNTNTFTNDCAFNTLDYSSDTANVNAIAATYTLDGQMSAQPNMRSAMKKTGVVEQGDISDQGLSSVNLDFEYCAFHIIEYQILPLSEKKFVTDDDVKRYCTTCGARVRKPLWQFCPSCGGKI